MTPLRIGTLGAARITPAALIAPARDRPEVVVDAVAARDRDRATEFAATHGIARVLDGYEALVSDPDLDVVYNPLPPSEHLRWTVAALEAGKHVLCEKPLAANADEARTITEAAVRTDRIVMEAFHWRYHPLADRMIDLVASGRLGAVRHIEAVFTHPIPDRNDIRHRFDLAGGSLMDLGCYPVQWIRALCDGEPEVISAHAVEGAPHIDAFLEAELTLPGGGRALLRTGMEDVAPARFVSVVGSDARLHVENPLAPQHGHFLRIDDGPEETVDGDTSYGHQLDAFVDAVRHGGPVPTDAADGVRNMTLIDAVYAAAGLPVRGTVPTA